VNEPKTKYRWWITYLLKDLQVGDNFKPGLAHLTVIPWFVTDLDEEEVVESFNHNFAAQPAFGTTTGEPIDFENKRRIPVNLISPTAEILSLHFKALEMFDELGARWALSSPHVAEDYIPHVRRRPGSRLKTGDELKIEAVYLIKAARAEDGQRTVAAKVQLV
jgi:hypothetical protein